MDTHEKIQVDEVLACLSCNFDLLFAAAPVENANLEIVM